MYIHIHHLQEELRKTNTKQKILWLLVGMLAGSVAMLSVAVWAKDRKPEAESKPLKPLSFKLPMFAVDYERQPDEKIVLTSLTGANF